MEQTPVTFSPEAAGLMALMGPPAPISFAPSAVEPMGPTMAELEAGRASESSKVSPEVKSAVDTLLGLWDSGSGSSGSHQGVIRHHARLLKDDFVANIPSNTSSASEADRLKYAMAILKTGETAQGMFSGKGLNAWNAATSPLINAYKPAATTQWVSTQEGDIIDSRWEQIAPQLGFRGQMYTSVPVERFDEYGNRYQDTEIGVSPEFRNFVNQAKSQGYDFVQNADNIVNFNQRYGFRLPSGEILGEYSVRGDQDVRDFGKQLVSMAGMALPFIGGPLAASIGASILPASAAASIGSAIGASASAVTTAVGQAALQSGLTALGGGDTGDIIRAGVTGLVSQAVPSVVKDVVPSSLGALEPVVEKAISSAAMSGISGKGDPLEAALGSLAGSAVGAVSQGTELPPSVVKGAIELAKTGTLSPNSLINAAIGLSQTADEYQKQKAIEAAYADPSRALDVLQPPSTVRAETPEDVYGAEGDVLGQDFYTPTEQGTSLDDLIRYIDQEASSGPRPTPENLQPAEDTWMAQPEPSEPDLFTPQTQQPRDEFVEPYMTTPAEEPTVAKTPEPAPEPELFTPNIYDLPTEPTKEPELTAEDLFTAPELPVEQPPEEQLTADDLVAPPELPPATEPPLTLDDLFAAPEPVPEPEPVEAPAQLTLDDLFTAPELTPEPLPEIPVGPEEPTFDDLIRQLGLTPVEEVQPIGSVDEGYFVPPQGPTIEELLAGIGPGIQEGMAFGVVAPPTIDMTTPAEEPTVAETPEPVPEPELFTPSLGDLREEPVTIPPAEVAAPEAITPPPEILVGPEEPTFDDLIRQLGLTPPAEVQPVGSVDEGYFVPPQGPTIEDLLAGIGPGIQEGMAPGGLESIGYQPTIDEILASTPPGIQEGMAPGVVAPPTIEEILASIPPGIEEGMVPGGLEREGIPATPEELQAVDQIISQPSTPSVPVKIPTIPTAPTTPTAPKKTATSQQDIMGLMALMGAMGKKETPQRERNVADVSRGISMSPFGLPYGGRYE